MEIVEAIATDAEQIASIVSRSNRDVAELFNLTIENAPKHPSFCTKAWVLSDFKRGEKYFLCKEGGIAKGCVAYAQPDPDTAYLNRLAVLPEYRHQGIGSSLVAYLLDYSKAKKVRAVTIGIIAEHQLLKKWYLKLGFIEGHRKTFDHLPFGVQYMRYDL